mgnify:CR=1 FL=1
MSGLGRRNNAQSVKGASIPERRRWKWKSGTGENPDLGAKFMPDECPCGWEMSGGCPVGH